MAADALDIITVSELEAALNVDATDPATLAEKQQVVSAASRLVDQVYGPVVARAVTNELRDGGLSQLRPALTPVLGVTSVTEYDQTTATTLTAETNAVKPGSGYITSGAGHAAYLVRRSSGSDYVFTGGRGNIVVAYVAGRYARVASIAAASGGSNVVTFATVHGLAVGDLVNLSGFAPSGYDATWTVLTVPSTTTVTIGANLAAATTIGTNVDRRFKEAAIAAAIHLWQARGGGPGAATGDGVPFGGVPYNTGKLVERLKAMLPDDARLPGIG